LVVNVVGEALFTVTHSASRPFVVHAGTAIVQVLGTKFDVRRYPNDRATHVLVADGRVVVGETINTRISPSCLAQACWV